MLALNRRFLASSIVALSLLTSACAKKNEGSTQAPGATPEQTEAEKAAAEEAKKKAQEEREREAKSNSLIEQARIDIGTGHYLSAIKRGEEALAADPNSTDAYAVLGAAYWRAGDYLRSTEAFQKGVQIDAKDFGVAIGLARNAAAAGDHPKAIALMDTLIASESEGHEAYPCEKEAATPEAQCPDGGFCESTTNMCIAPRQALPRLSKFWSQYLLFDVASALKTSEELFVGAVGVDADGAELKFVRNYTAFLQFFADKGPLMQMEGTSGQSALMVEDLNGLKYSFVELAGNEGPSMAVISELQTENRIDRALAEQMGLQKLGQVTPFGMQEPESVVLIPEIKIGDLRIKNVPAMTQDLTPLQSNGETPGVLMGRQLLHRLGSIAYNFSGQQLTFNVAQAPAEGSELPLLMLDMRVMTVPVIPVAIDGQAHKVWSWFGGIYPSAVALTQKAFLKSGRLPREVENPEDPDRGLKMVYIESLDIGSEKIPGVGGLVLVNHPPDAGLQQVVDNTLFEIGGYLNYAAVKSMKITVSYSSGKMWVQKG